MTASLNTSRLSLGALIAGGGGLVLFISLFLDWFEEVNAFDIPSVDLTPIVLLVIALIAIGVAAMQLVPTPPALPVEPATVAKYAGVLAIGILLPLIEFPETKFGIWLAFLSSIAILVGAVMATREPVTGFREGAGGPGAGPGLGAGPGAAGPGGGFGGGGGGAPASPQAPGPAAETTAAGGQPQPDWYPDPKGEARLRYWDGSEWTDQTAD